MKCETESEGSIWIMTDYIRREDAIKIAERYGLANGSVLGRHTGLADCIASEILSLPAADVAPVVHGKWGDNGIAGSMLVKCSVCGFDCGANSFSYCPNCGARIRQAKRGKVRRKYGEILALYRYCVEAGMDVQLERLHDGWAVRFPNGGDFAQHAGTYGTHDGFVEPAIGCEADYSPVSLREAEKLIRENRERLMTPSCEEEQ
nr:MAG TPA: zinc binding protein [Caudoviricetes sp.]